jgi:hypothetical protein
VRFDACDEGTVKSAPADALWDKAFFLHVFENASASHFPGRDRGMVCCPWVAIEFCISLEDRDVDSLLGEQDAKKQSSWSSPDDDDLMDCQWKSVEVKP